MTRASASARAAATWPLISIVVSDTWASRRCSAAGSAWAPKLASPTVTIVEVRTDSSRLAGSRRADRSRRSMNDGRAGHPAPPVRRGSVACREPQLALDLAGVAARRAACGAPRGVPAADTTANVPRRRPGSDAAVKTDVEELSPTRVKLTIEVPFEELKPSLEKAYREVS